MKTAKMKYEKIKVELILLQEEDILTGSGPFDLEDDDLGDQ